MSKSVEYSYGSALDATSSTTGTNTAPPRIACPYYKINGRRGIKGRSCNGEGFTNVNRTKYASTIAPNIFTRTLNINQRASV